MQNNSYNLNPSYNKDAIRKNISYWWMGQIVDEKHWLGNEILGNHERDDSSGWGKRYRVRIFSQDSKIKDGSTSVPDSQLLMADTIAPVTGGSGHGGYGETIVLEQGSYVMGFYLDGEEGRQPIIIGCLPNNAQTRLFGGDPSEGFIPRSGFRGNLGNKKVATKDLHTKPSSIPERESTTTDGGVNDVRRVLQAEDGSDVGVRKLNIECEGGGGPMKGVQGFIQRALALIKRIKKTTQGFLGAVSDITSNIQKIVNETSSFIASFVKLIITKMRGYVLNQIDKGITKLASKLSPNLRQVFSEGTVKGTDTLSCVFQKIIKGLFSLVKNLFKDIVEKYINAPMCAAEKFLGDLMGGIIGDISSGINGFLGSISGLVGTAQGIADKAFSVLDIVAGLLNFLKCDETPNCDYRDRWSFWNGDKEADAVSKGLGNLLRDAANNIGGDIPDPGSCSTDQLPCGPPSINFSGGGGSGILANPIVSLSGKIMGLDFSSFGSGYSATPSLSVEDGCGIGGGAGISLLSQYDDSPSADISPKAVSGDESISVIGAVVIDPGQNYLPTISKDRTNISSPEDSIYIDPNCNWQVYKPGTTIVVPNVDQENIDPNCPRLYLPENTQVSIIDTETGNVIDNLIGRGPLTPIKIPTGVTITTPEPVGPLEPSPVDDPRPIVNGESVDVILDGIYIENTGANYSSGDQIIVDGADGVEMLPVFDNIGRLVDVVITNPGDIINDYPRIYIKSETGVNANILPVFRVRRPDEDPDDRDTIVTGDRIVTIDECVGTLVIGYINGKPYYGNYYYYNGRRVAGKKNNNIKNRIYIYDTPEESLSNNSK